MMDGKISDERFVRYLMSAGVRVGDNIGKTSQQHPIGEVRPCSANDPSHDHYQ